MKTLLCCMMLASVAFAQSRQELKERVTREYQEHRYAEAERDLRQLAKDDPSDPQVPMLLGHLQFQQQKFGAAIEPYEKARELDRTAKELTLAERRVVTDNLVISYGLTGKLAKCHELLAEAVAKDPKYAMNYYNLACTFAEENKKSEALANLSLAFRHKDEVIAGESVPDPRQDPSFEKYLKDPDFVKLMKQLGFNEQSIRESSPS